MGRTMHKLTARRVDTIKEPGKYGDGGGLWLRVERDGSRRWVYLWQREKRSREMGLGAAFNVTLAQARAAAAEARGLVARGIDPIEARIKALPLCEGEIDGTWTQAADTAQTVAPSFMTLATAYIDTHESGWKNAKHRQQWRNSITTHAKQILDMPVDTIVTDDIVAVLTPIWQKIPETASRLRGRIEIILDAAKAANHIASPWENPARWRGNLVHRLPNQRRKAKVNHHAAMPFEGLPAFYASLRKRPAMAARALEMTILCATRTNETLQMTWAEIDLQNGTWTIPKERMKMEVEHSIPLSNRAIELLNEVAARTDRLPDSYVFPGQKKGMPLSQMAMTMVLRRMNLGQFTVHGMRSCFSDYMADMTDFAEEVIEQALAHQVGSKVKRAYRRRHAFLKRKVVMEHWAQYLVGTKSQGEAITAE